MLVAAALWKRLDTPGHDACCLERLEHGWRLQGTAVFRDAGEAAQLTYQVTCDPTWVTEGGIVCGWRGSTPVSFQVKRLAQGIWTLNGTPVSGLKDCQDLDLGFTPATNLLQLRRLGLAQGESSALPVAWLDGAVGTLTVLQQHYERRSEHTYWYEAPSADYQGLLEVSRTGFIRHYPNLWVSEL